MKQKNRLLVVFLSLSFFVGSLALFGSQQDTEESSEVPEVEKVKIVKGMHPFYDAKDILAALKEGKKKVIFAILAKYVEGDILNLGQAEFKFEENTFLTNWLDENKEKLKPKAEDKEEKSVPVQVESPPSALKGILSPTMVVDALGRLIAKRFKEELTIRYLKKFRKKLEDTELSKLFPSTKDFLVRSDIFNFKIFMSTLKEAFQNDLNNLDSNFTDYLKSKSEGLKTEIEKTEKNDKLELEKKKKILNIVLFFWDIFAGVKRGNHPIGVIGNIDNLEFIKDIDDKEMDAVRLVVWIARNLSNKEGDGLIWKNKEEFSDFLGDENIRELYLGLCYAGVMKYLRNTALKENIKKKFEDSDRDRLKVYVGNAINMAREIRVQIVKMKDKKKGGEKITFEDYHSYLQTIYKQLETGYKGIGHLFLLDEDVKKKIEMYLGYVDDFFEISMLIHDKAYGIAILNVIKLLNKVADKDSDIVKKIVKYLSFLNTMARVKDAKEMQVAMGAFFLPVGSYRMNRANVFSFTVNAYPGAFLSSERLTTEEQIGGNKKAGNIGLAAPIGLALTWSLRKGHYDKPGPSLSLFFSAIDIGAVFNWRLSSDVGLPEIKWKNVVAPGAFLMFGWKNHPITIGGGIQYGPQLREIKPAEPEGGSPEAVIMSKSVRIGLIIAVDIPILRIYQKAKLE